MADIAAGRRLSGRGLDRAQERVAYRSYRAGDVIWRTHGPLRFSGHIQSGEIELEYRVDGVPARTTRLCAGAPLPPRVLHKRRPHDLVIARAVTDVRLRLLPELKQAQGRSVARHDGGRWMKRLWPVMLLLLVAVLAWEDIVRIGSDLFYLAAAQEGGASSMSLLKGAQQVDNGAVFAYNEEGYRWFQQNDLPGAALAFNEALAMDPASAPALNNLAVVYFIQGDLAQAAHYLQQAVGQDPNNPIARYNLGIIRMQLRDPEGAIREFREAGFIDPQAVGPLLLQASLYHQNGDPLGAEQRARSALRLDPSLVPAHLLLGMALYDQGREADALASFARTLSLEPGNRVAAFYQALILGHLKQYDAALPVLHSLLASSSDASETMRILVEIDALYRYRSDSGAAGY